MISFIKFILFIITIFICDKCDNLLKIENKIGYKLILRSIGALFYFGVVYLLQKFI